MPALTILKLGGSVLRNEADLRLAVHEIYRHYREGDRVIGVVSAFEGTTDALLRQAAAYTETAESDASCTLAATGELTTASLLTLALHKAGIPAQLLTPHQLDFRAEGCAADAQPRSIQRELVARALDHTPIAVIPGFVAIDGRGAFTLLGRGGSDLTALFLAAELGATRCRLIKDVDGLYERDPALPGPRPRRFAEISYDDALILDGGIVQHKAVRFARDRGLCFEVGAFSRDDATLVGAPGSRFAELSSPDRRPRVVLLGAGTVGGGLYDHLRQLQGRFRVQRIAVRNIEAAVARGLPRELLTSDPLAAASEPCDIVVELMGGLEPAGACIRAALAQGKHVVTANKRLLAAVGDDLRALARSKGVHLLYSAAVGGGVPMLEAVRRIARTDRITRIEGVLNGTTNYVLNRATDRCLERSVSASQALHSAITESQTLGLAEADPTADLHAFDAAQKLSLLAQAAGCTVCAEEITRDALTPERFEHLVDGAGTQDACKRPRQVARLDLGASGATRAISASITLQLLDPAHPLARCRGPENKLLIHTASGRIHEVRGLGAGRWPTSESVLADLLDLTRPAQPPTPAHRTIPRKRPNIGPFTTDPVPVSGEIQRCEQPNSVPALA